MKRSLFGFAAIASLFATPALAADIPFKALPPPVPLFVWTGFYGGVNAGYSWGSSLNTTDLNPATGITPALYTEGITHRGWEASVEGGFCWQQSPTTAFVACLEVRYDFPRETSPSTTTATIIPGATQTTVTSTTHIDPLLIGPHLGFLTNANHTMWYAAGGLAIGQVGGSSVGTGLLGTSTASPPSGWATGWFAGAGVEQMLNDNWGLKLEYDYVHFDTNGVAASYTGSNLILNYPGFPSTATLASHPYDNVVSVGINYHIH
jgi:outer membrane immunogenic protein